MHRVPLAAHQPPVVVSLLLHQVPLALRHCVTRSSFSHSLALATVFPFLHWYVVGQACPCRTLLPSVQVVKTSIGGGGGLPSPSHGQLPRVPAVERPSGQRIEPAGAIGEQGSALHQPVALLLEPPEV